MAGVKKNRNENREGERKEDSDLFRFAAMMGN